MPDRTYIATPLEILTEIPEKCPQKRSLRGNQRDQLPRRSEARTLLLPYNPKSAAAIPCKGLNEDP